MSYIDSERLFNVLFFGSRDSVSNMSLIKLPDEQIEEIVKYFKKMPKMLTNYIKFANNNTKEMDLHIRNYIGATVTGMSWLRPSVQVQ